LGAAHQLQLAPETLIYVGDDERDMVAAQSAGMPGIVARYGYLGLETAPEDWPAEAHIHAPIELLNLLT
jgi:phosphoglycolate phosphatase